TPWTYSLDLTDHTVSAQRDMTDQPFTPKTAPVELHMRGRRVPAWKSDSTGMVGKLQDSPVKSDEPLETITLIPMGAARLRISSFPVIGHGLDAKEWINPPAPPTASHVNPSDTTTALTDNQIPSSSNDHSIALF